MCVCVCVCVCVGVCVCYKINGYVGFLYAQEDAFF